MADTDSGAMNYFGTESNSSGSGSSPWSYVLSMLAAQTGKEVLFDAPERKKQNILAAKQTELSPWTKMGAGELQPNNFGGNMFQAGVTGFGLGQQVANAQAQQDLLRAQAGLLNRTKVSPSPITDPFRGIV